MQHVIKQISKELTSIIQKKELELIDVIKDIPPIISFLEEGFQKLKQIVSLQEFPSPLEEICFFKETKPKLFSKLIYLRKIYQLELNRPISNYETTRTLSDKRTRTNQSVL